MSEYGAVTIIGANIGIGVSVSGSGAVDYGEAIAHTMHTIVDPLTKIAERIGVEAVDTSKMGDGVYLGSADGKRLYSWPDVVDKLVSRISPYPNDVPRVEPRDSTLDATEILLRVLPGVDRRWLYVAVEALYEEFYNRRRRTKLPAVSDNEPHDSIEAAVDAITNVVPGAVIDDVRDAVKTMIAAMHAKTHADLERGDAEGGDTQ
jgi:hypothetical protein